MFSPLASSGTEKNNDKHLFININKTLQLKLIHKIDQSYKVGREESKQNLKNSLENIKQRRSKIENSRPEERQRLKKMDFMLKIGQKITQQQIAETS